MTGWALACVVASMALASVGCETNPILRERASMATARGDLVTAELNYRKAVERNPTDHKAQYGLGLTLLAMNKPMQAQIALEKAWSLKPNRSEFVPGVLDALAQAYEMQNRPEMLVNFLAEAVDRYGTTADYLRQAKYLIKIGDLDGAKLALRKAAYFAKKGDAKPYLVIADFYEQINDVPNAVTALRYAYFVDEDHPAIPDRFRRHGLVPGPTLKLEPPKPEMLD